MLLQLFPGQSDGSMVGAMVFAFPLSFFYYFLYYTDTLSTLALLLCYWVSASNINRFSASGVNGTFIILQLVQLATAIIAILARQTNAVWLLHIAGTCMLRCVEENKSFRYVKLYTVNISAVTYIGCVCSDVPLSSLSPTSLIAFVRSLFTSSPELLVVTWPLLLPVLLFIVFVFGFNEGGIVVGDKDNHRMVVHAAMPLHLGMAISLLLGPWEMIVGILELAKASITVLQSKSFPILEKMKLVLLVLVAFSAVSAVLFWGCLPHPFLEADNRFVIYRQLWRLTSLT
jgi:alpha-1,2-glucosyltransferase